MTEKNIYALNKQGQVWTKVEIAANLETFILASTLTLTC